MQDVQYPLFVYGTLLTGERAHGLLSTNVNRVREASLGNAVLYSLGAYPILVAGGGVVAGELCWIKIAAYADLLEQLDRYEGPQYSREIREVRQKDAASQTKAWVYVGKHVPADAVPCPHNDWRVCSKAIEP